MFFYRMRTASFKEVESESKNYHKKDIDILIWKNRKKTKKPKKVATVTLAKTGQIFATYFEEKAKTNKYVGYQVKLAKAYLLEERTKTMPHYEEEYPFVR